MICNENNNTRPRAVVLLCSEPHTASKKVKLCKLIAKMEERLGLGRSPLARALVFRARILSYSTVPQKKNMRLLAVLDNNIDHHHENKLFTQL